MKISDIENNIKIPIKVTAKYRLVVANCERLKTGQSFLVSFAKEEKLSPAGMSKTIAHNNKGTDKKFAVRKINETAIRVWRVK